MLTNFGIRHAQAIGDANVNDFCPAAVLARHGKRPEVLVDADGKEVKD
jgi:hypothetical protein